MVPGLRITPLDEGVVESEIRSINGPENSACLREAVQIPAESSGKIRRR